MACPMPRLHKHLISPIRTWVKCHTKNLDIYISYILWNVQSPHHISGADNAGITFVRELRVFCLGVPSCSCCCA